jgi:hypothetical protein
MEITVLSSHRRSQVQMRFAWGTSGEEGVEDDDEEEVEKEENEVVACEGLVRMLWREL